MQAIGIDIGTTSISGVVIDTESGAVLRSRTENSNAFIETENSWEKIQSVEKIIGLATDILNELICEDTAVIGVTGQMHGIVYTDIGGLAVSPLYTWQDGRGNLPYETTTYAEALGSCSGYGNVTDFYNRKNGLVPESAVNFCTIHDYFVMRLCGLKKAVIHTSDAASFGCFDLESNTFSYENGINAVDGYSIAGEYKGIPVSVAIGDNQASVFSCLSGEEELLINVGTGSQVSVISENITVAENIETRPFFEGKYLIVGSALCGGRAYAVLKNFYRSVLQYATDLDDKSVYGIMDKMLDGTTESSLKVDTRFSGTRADETLRGSINGISTENFTPQELCYGTLSGMTEELYEMFSKMNVTRSKIVGSGNGIRFNKKLIEIIEKRFMATLKIPKHTEEAAFGAARYGLICCGIYKNAEDSKQLISFI